MAWVTISDLHQRTQGAISEIAIRMAAQRAETKAEETGEPNDFSRKEGRLWYINDESSQARRWLAKRPAKSQEALLEEENSRLAGQLATSDATIEELRGRIAELEAQLGRERARAEEAEEKAAEAHQHELEQTMNLLGSIVEAQTQVLRWQKIAIAAQQAQLSPKAASPSPQDTPAQPEPVVQSELPLWDSTEKNRPQEDGIEEARAQLAHWQSHPTPMPDASDIARLSADVAKYVNLCHAAHKKPTQTSLAELWVTEEGVHPARSTVKRRMDSANLSL